MVSDLLYLLCQSNLYMKCFGILHKIYLECQKNSTPPQFPRKIGKNAHEMQMKRENKHGIIINKNIFGSEMCVKAVATIRN
jgi:hypothetical protein